MNLVYIIFPGERLPDIENWYIIKTLSRALYKLGYCSKVLCLDDYSPEQIKNIRPPIGAVYIHVFTYLMYNKYYEVIQTLNSWNTTFLISGNSHHTASNKALVYSRLEQAGFNVPKTLVDPATNVFDSLGTPVVVKPAHSFEGQFTSLCYSEEELNTAINATKNCKFRYENEYTIGAPTLVQEYLNYYDDLYIRVHVAGESLYGYMGIVSPYEDKKFNNFNKHKFRIPYNVDTTIQHMVKNMLKFLDISVVACDMLMTKDDVKIVDVNSLGQYKTLDIIYGINFADKIAECFDQKIKANTN